MFIFHPIYFNLMMPTVLALTYTPGNLFDTLDTDKNGMITETEFVNAVKDMGTIQIDNTPCSCFSCEGELLQFADTCDVYENSGCSTPVTIIGGCYTTNLMKCNCNLFLKNPDVCKIPLTYSFTNYTPPSVSNHNLNLKRRRGVASAIKPSSDYYDRLDTAYSHGRNSAWNDFADAVVTYHVMDAGLTLFGEVLAGKD